MISTSHGASASKRLVVLSSTKSVLGALLLTALTNGLTLVGVSEFYQPLSVGIVVVLAALLSRFQK